MSFSALIPLDTVPGYYELRIFAPDDLTDNLDDENAGRWLTMNPLSILLFKYQALLDIFIPSEVTPPQFFTISGMVMDSVDSNRTIQGPVDIEIFFLDDPDEILISDFTTTTMEAYCFSTY